jgi:hypothetical protein
MRTKWSYTITAYKLFLKFVSLFFLLSINGFSQSTTNISGVVNSYYQVIEVMPAIYALKVNNPSGLVENDRVLIVQMKGASINTANGSGFGDTTALNEAGNYETAVICRIRTDTVYFYHTFLNTYTPVAGKVQLVKMAEYYSANVIDTIKATSWDNTAGTGGVIAIFCSQDLTLNAPIYADSSGYDGGAFVASSGSCSNFLPANAYYYTATNTSPQGGAWKGEGVAILASNQTGGRGAPANGGGGGNNHNNSGGGGANLSAGGIGGGNSSTAGCTTTLRGLAGKALSSWNGQKIFLGGGGGAGHSNGAIYTKGGGNGGGIIFIHAENLIGNGYKISANGGAGGQSQSDGAGGGGAGGTIIADITTYTGSLIMQVNGGAGGNSDDGGNVGRCYGGGGGGSGGIIYFSGSTPAITVNTNGGNAGNETGRDLSCGAAVPAGAGTTGSVVLNYLYKRSTEPATGCGNPLPVILSHFIAEANDEKVLLQWKLETPEIIDHFIVDRKTTNNNWITIKTVTALPQSKNYSTEDPFPVTGKNYYRIRVVENNGKQTYSVVRLIDLTDLKTEFSFYPNPAKHSITITRKMITPATINLLDISGKLILQKQLTAAQTVIDLPSLSPGIYILRLNGMNKKLVIH